ncbi:hypothetical protein SRHO_G00140820 [Serrasalmus rhombeus]
MQPQWQSKLVEEFFYQAWQRSSTVTRCTISNRLSWLRFAERPGSRLSSLPMFGHELRTITEVVCENLSGLEGAAVRKQIMLKRSTTVFAYQGKACTH